MKRGQLVSFPFGKVPKTKEGKALYARRARNIQEAAILAAAKDAYSGGWNHYWSQGYIEAIDGNRACVDGYWFDLAQLRA